MELFNSIFLWCVIRYVITYVILYTEIKKPFKRVKSSFEPTVKSNVFSLRFCCIAPQNESRNL